MGFLGKVCGCSAVGAALLAVVVGLFAAGVPTQLGFFVWLAGRSPRFVGYTPAFTHGIEPGFDFAKLAALDLSGRRAVITGANSGLGRATALHLARQGADVVLACRNADKCAAAAAAIRQNVSSAAPPRIQTMALDTSDLESVRAFSKALLADGTAIDMLYLNAGIGCATPAGEPLVLNAAGVEMVFATNVLGHHLLYALVLPLLEKAREARVVVVSSSAQFNPPPYGVATDLKTLNEVDSSTTQYYQSKFANVLWAIEATRRLGPGSSVLVNSCHPGVVNTGIWDVFDLVIKPPYRTYVRNFFQMLQDQVMWSSEQGALTQLYLGAAEHSSRGKYFHPQAQPVEPHPLSKDEALGKRFWAFCDELAGLAK